MPQLLKHIDAIAREKKRDVLFIRFVGDVAWRDLEIRTRIIDWLEANKIGWLACGDFANENYMASYRGQIYVDLPYDRDLEAYQQLEAFLEHPDGTMRFPQVEFCCVTHEGALKNVHHDVPGFWEKWAETF